MHVCLKDFLASCLDRSRVFETTGLSSFLIVRIFFLIILLMSLFVCLSSFGIVMRFCMSRRRDSSCSLLVIVLWWCCCCCTARQNIFEFVVEVLGFCVVGRRVGVDRVEGLILVCLVNVYRVLVPVEFVVTASSALFGCLSRWPSYLLSLVVHGYCDSSCHCFVVAINKCRSDPSLLHLCSV